MMRGRRLESSPLDREGNRTMSSRTPASRFTNVKIKHDRFGNPGLVLAAERSGWSPYLFGILLAGISGGLSAFSEIGRVAAVVAALAAALLPHFLVHLYRYTCLRVTPWEIQLIRGRLFLRRSRSASLFDIGEITYEAGDKTPASSDYVIVLKWKDDSQWRINSRLNTAEQAQWVVEQLRTWIHERSRGPP